MYRKSNLFNIFFMLALLASVFLMIYVIDQQRKKLPVLPNVLDQFEESARVIGHTYYNKPFRFLISIPDSSWEFVCATEVDSSIVTRSTDAEPGWVAEIRRPDDGAVMKIGIFMNDDGLMPESLALNSLLSVRRRFNAIGQVISVVADVTTAGTGDLSSAYYVLELSDTSQHPYPVWIDMVFRRNQMAYQISCQVRRDRYESLRPGIEDILKSFRFIY